MLTTIDRNANCPCGSTKKYKHCCQRKEKATAASKRNANFTLVPNWLKLGADHLRAERIAPAQNLFERILEVDPRHPDALHLLGLIAHKQGNSQKAVDLIQQAIARRPTNAFYLGTLGNTYKDLEQFDLAIESYRRALALKLNTADIHNNLGVALHAQGKLDEAIQSYKKALEIIPNSAEIINNLGLSLYVQGFETQAVQAFKKATELDPNLFQAYLNIGKAMVHRAPVEAIRFFEKSLSINPNYYDAWVLLGMSLRPFGAIAEAAACIHSAYALKPSGGLKVFLAMLLPPIMGTKSEVELSRKSFEDNLERISQEQIEIVNPVNEIFFTSFYMAFHGLNDKYLQKKVADFYAQACPSLLYVAPHCKQPRNSGRRRIGFLSRFISKHSVALSFSGIVSDLALLGDFEVSLISWTEMNAQALQETYPNFAGVHVSLSEDLAVSRQQIAELELDILVYLDIGMDTPTYLLAFARLARKQCVLGGHPVTTGIANMDYFISSELMEIEGAQEHYTEKLVRLPFGLFYFKRPALPTSFKSRAELGMPSSGNVYICPMMLQKLHPDFDDAMARILELDPTGHVVLINDNKYGYWKSILEKRFERTIPENVRARIQFLPWVADYQDFMGMVRAADVLLDSFHFGIGTTVIATCSVGTPFVTRPSEFMRGRAGMFFANLMLVPECIALDCEDYAQKAVAFATNKVMRKETQGRILSNNHVLFDNAQGIQDGIDFFGKLDVEGV